MIAYKPTHIDHFYVDFLFQWFVPQVFRKTLLRIAQIHEYYPLTEEMKLDGFFQEVEKLKRMLIKHQR